MPSLSEILRTKLIPWSTQNASERFIVARRKMRQADMPYGVRLVPHKIQSQRVLVKNRRCYNNVRNIVAEWPEAGLQELGKYTLICVLGGDVSYQLGNYKVQCGPGHFIFIPPGIPRPDGSRTYVDLEKSTSCDIITFLLHPNALECWSSHGQPEGRERDNNCLVLHERTVAIFHALVEEVLEREENASQVGAELLHVFLTILQREVDARRFQPVRSDAQAEQKTLSALPTDFSACLERYVQMNLQKPLTLDIVSAAMYFPPTHFARLMRRETGKSFNEYLAEHRLAEAKNLLCNSQWSISTIAKLVGFHSASYFCTFFKGHVGVTPGEFRARALENSTKP
jgi:AraC-like DNA-binding protein